MCGLRVGFRGQHLQSRTGLRSADTSQRTFGHLAANCSSEPIAVLSDSCCARSLHQKCRRDEKFCAVEQKKERPFKQPAAILSPQAHRSPDHRSLHAGLHCRRNDRAVPIRSLYRGGYRSPGNNVVLWYDPGRAILRTASIDRVTI